jgi:hypothetical protein
MIHDETELEKLSESDEIEQFRMVDGDAEELMNLAF